MLFKRRDKREEFERAVKEVFPAIYSTARRLTRQEEDARDLTQDTLIKAYQAWDRFDGRNLKAWLLRIMTNTFINRVRKEKREPERVSLDDSAELAQLPAEDAAPLEQILDRIVDDDIEAAIQSLPPDYRAAVVLSDVEGLSYPEIAEALGIPVGTVRSRLARGRALLRSKLSDYAKEHGIV
jgi:RNA polymerase sigma-70 factor (ECF subfamily)